MKTISKYIAPRLLGLGEIIAMRVRKKIYKRVIEIIQPNEDMNVLDIGVTCDRSLDSNFFEFLYPFKEKITAVGLEDASYLENEYPGLKFQIADACNLPFNANQFDLAFCSAVIEHVGSISFQEKLIAESTRVAKQVVITTPNRYFPIEFHTLTPFIHWLDPKIFRFFLRITYRNYFAKEKNLNLLSSKDLESILVKRNLSYIKSNQKILGMESNLVYIINKKS